MATDGPANMHELPSHDRILLLTEGRLGVFTSKTAASLLRYRADDIVAVVDSVHAGRELATIIPWSPPRPILPSVAAAQGLQPDALYVGIAPVGGALTAELRRHVCDALRAGLDVVSGLHARVSADAECRRLAAERGARIFDLREPPARTTVACGKARETRCRRILTVGSDAAVGKMVAALELTDAARRRSLNTRFVATGQTGIMIARRGVAIDAVVSDFAAGAVEEMVCAAGECDVCVVEGQGSLGHPGFSGVTLSILHGACPDALILVHHAGRTHYRSDPALPLPDLQTLRRTYEQIAGLLHPARVAGIALNTFGVDPATAQREAERISTELELPVADVMAGGADALLEAATTI